MAARSHTLLRASAHALLMASLAALCLGGAVAAAAVGDTQGSTAPTTKPPAAATLVECLTSTEQSERSATFQGEMTAIPGSAKMEMRVDVLERSPRELAYRNIAAPGLGAWRAAAPGVKVYKYLKQVTNLSAPAAYRAAIRFRWLNAKGKLIKAMELRTPKCLQPLHPRVPPPGEATVTTS
jgi:hypothetical protein